MSNLLEQIKQNKMLRSLKLRIFAMIVITGLVPCVILHNGTLDMYLDNAVSIRANEVQTQVKIIADHLIAYNFWGNNTKNDIIDAELAQLSNLYDGRVLVIDSNLTIVKDTYDISKGKTIISEQIIKCLKGEGASSCFNDNRYIEVVVPIEEKTEQESRIVGVMLTSASTDSIMASYHHMEENAYILEIMVMVVIVGIGLFLSSKILKPFDKITQAINEVKNGFTDEEISVTAYIETEEIGDAFNQMMVRMKVLDESRQEFVSNVSHELKTPLTSMKVLADSLLMQEDVPAELYKEFMTDIAAEIDRENKIITDLLSLVKMTRTSADINVELVDINANIELLLKRLGPIAARAEVELIFESHRQVSAEIDEIKLTLAISNLVENGIKYNHAGGWVKVILDADHQYFTVEVEDSGIGMPQEALEHIYERFYRVDKSHSKEVGGTGLGLAITRSVILMHRGSIDVISEEGEGTVFKIKIPLTYIQS